MKGKVYLVGAGPGDPGLLTVKAARVLREADLIVYDYLTNPQHLRHARAGARTVGVGKGFRHKAMSQQRINRLILAAAARGGTVVRLKGGDPYLFGRGGEEALFLRSHGVPFEVVPGVTSATACAAYAGIPLTHRDHNQSVTFVTGHRAGDADLDSIDWDKIVRIGGTIVIYMGFYNLARIAERLTANGMPASTRVAVVEWGTLPRQRTCDGTLRDIAARVRGAGLAPPCLIIVGDVVSLRGRLAWFERLPLFGKRVLVTRMREKAGRMSERLSDAGAQAVEFPVIEIVAAPRGPLESAARRLDRFDWVVFASVYGVEAFFDALGRSGRDTRALAGVKVASVGRETGEALRQRGVRADLQPARYETAALVEAFAKKYRLSGKRVLLVRSDIAPAALETGLRRQGALLARVVGYRTRPAAMKPGRRRAALEGPVDYVTFTSASTVDGFVRALGRARVRKLARRAALASIGPVTSAALRRHGLQPTCEASRFTVDGLVDAIAAHARKKGKRA